MMEMQASAAEIAPAQWKLTELFGHWAESHGVTAGVVLALGVAATRLRRRLTGERAELRRERRLREELEAYAGLELGDGLGAGGDAMESARILAGRVCGTIAKKSIFTRVTMLLRGAEGRFAVLASVGADDLTVAALDAWGEKVVAGERGGRRGAETGEAKSFSISLGEWRMFDPEVRSWTRTGRKERRRWRRAVIVPVRGHSGRMLGAICVCADGERVDGCSGHPAWGASLSRAIGPIEGLAGRLAAALENDALAVRLLRAEKLAGLGQLAGGVAHALNNPLTAVLGFADLIAETAEEPRVRKDAGVILVEAIKMKETVERLVEFWRPRAVPDQAVDMTAILRELDATCRGTLETRGVWLEISGVEQAAPAVRGCRNRLREVLEHLLNNAAQAIAGFEREGETHAIRVVLTHDERVLHVVISDSGPGFADPGRIFDPFYTTAGPEPGSGMGLSLCYGIVREHGGEISAFNLHPHGAAVVVELPVRRVVEDPGVAKSDSLTTDLHG